MLGVRAEVGPARTAGPGVEFHHLVVDPAVENGITCAALAMIVKALAVRADEGSRPLFLRFDVVIVVDPHLPDLESSDIDETVAGLAELRAPVEDAEGLTFLAVDHD